MSSITVFDYSGLKVAEIVANVKRSWAINRVGDAEFTLSVYSPTFKESTLQFGNWILVRSDNIPDWVGMIDPERRWNSGSVTVRAYSAYQIAKYRRIVDDKQKGSPGALARWGLGHVSSKGNISLECRTFDQSGSAIEEVVGETTVMSFIDGLLQKSPFELSITGVVVSNILSLQADWVKSLGYDTGALLAEGVHYEAGSGLILEQGDLYNDLFGISNGATSSNRKTSTAVNSEAQKIYGIRSGVITFDSQEGGTVEVLTRTEVDRKAYPRRTLSAVLTNAGTSAQFIGLGNRVTVESYTMGFTGGQSGCRFPARITAIEIDEGQGRTRILADEVI